MGGAVVLLKQALAKAVVLLAYLSVVASYVAMTRMNIPEIDADEEVRLLMCPTLQDTVMRGEGEGAVWYASRV